MDEILRERFAKNLKKALEDNGLTQSEMAKYMRVSTATASDWCNGVKMPRADKLQSLSNWLHIELTDLLLDYKPSSAGAKRSTAEPLTASEEQLISSFRQLNGEGQSKVIDYAADLAASGRYIKDLSAEAAGA